MFGVGAAALLSIVTPTASAQPAATAQPTATASAPSPPGPDGAPQGDARDAPREVKDEIPPLPAANSNTPVSSAVPQIQPEASAPVSTSGASPGSFSAWRGAGRNRRLDALGAPDELDPERAERDDRMAKIRSWRTLAAVGATLFFVPYLPSVFVAGVAGECQSSCDRDTKHLGWLAVPAAGPFIATAFMDRRLDDAERGVLIANGVAQSLGLLTFVGSIAMARQLNNTPFGSERAVSLRVAPLVTPSGGGLSVTGSF